MKRIKKTIKGLSEIIKNPWLLNNIINDDTVWSRYVKKKYNVVNGLPVVDINHIDENFSTTLEYFAFLDGSCLPTDILLLKTLARKFDLCNYFEIGTWRGESVANVSSVAEECYTLNLSKSELISMGYKEKYTDLHGFFSKGKSNIKHLSGNSLDFDFDGINKKFDLIFIDGDHHYDFVKNDTQKVFKHLVHENSIVVWHDYARNPETFRPEVLAAIFDGTPQEFRKYLYHVSNTMCAVFIRREFPTKELDAPETPNKTFKVVIESRSL